MVDRGNDRSQNLLDSDLNHNIMNCIKLYKETIMRFKLGISFLFLVALLVFSACDEDKPPAMGIETALSNYWDYQTDLNNSLESRDGTMAGILTQINGLNTRSGKDAISDIGALVDQYVAKSEDAADDFQVLLNAENAIVPYGGSKGILSSIAKGIYTKAKDTVVSSGRMVRSGWRVLSGSKSLRQVLNDPESGIPIVSTFAERMQKHNADRDASIRTSILENNSQGGMIPLGDLEGTTPQEKLNYYINLPDESPLKMSTRRDVMYWDEAERTRTAQTAKGLGEDGVKIVGDAYGGAQGEWVNEVLVQHMEEGQTANQAGDLNVQVNQSGTGTPPITGGKTLIISKADMPDSDPRITVIMNAPQNLEQPLPTGSYNIIAVADGFIRGVYENMQILQSQATNVLTELLKLSENAIVIENLTVDEGSVQVGQVIHAHVACISTIGKSLSFSWEVTGGTYTNLVQDGVDMSFKPTEEKEYTITVTVTDNASHSKSKSIAIASLSSSLAIDDQVLVVENFEDDKLNPGEAATVRLYVTNVGTQPLTGTQNVTGQNGVVTNFVTGPAVFAPGATNAVDVPFVVPANYSQPNATLLYNFYTVNQAQVPVQVQLPAQIPVEFYVQIDDIESPVTDRVLQISGKVANPQLQTAILTLDNDPDQTFELNLNNGSFYQNVALSGAPDPVNHVVKVVAVSGGLIAEDTESFTSEIPVTALRATLTWDTSGTDVDFWITDPNGEKCYYAHSTTASGLELDFDDTDGYGPENITTSTVIPGDYIVQVHYYSDHNSSVAIGSNCVVVIRQNEGSNEPPVNYYGYVSDTGDVWNVTTIHYDAAKGWSMKANGTHSKVNPSTLPAK